MADATLHKTLQGHRDWVRSVAFSLDGKFIASASYDHSVRLWNIPNGDLNAELKGHEHDVSSVAFSPDGKSIVTGSYDEIVRTWSVATKQQVKILSGHSSSVYSVAWSPNGTLIASGSDDKTVILWDAISGSMKKKLKGRTSSVYSVSFSQNGNQLVSGGYDNTAIIWDVNSGAALIKLAHSHSVWSVCFSYDDQFVVTGSQDNIVRMFNANNGHEEKRFEGHTNSVLSVAISFDGSMIGSGDDSSVRLWDAASTKQLQQLDGHTKMVNSVAFSRDGKFIASGSWDKTVCLWNAPSSLQTPTSLLKSACFAGDVDAAKFQLDQGALVNSKDGSTALYAASSKGSKQLVELLIERGADMNLRENNGSSALHAASYQGHQDVVAYLLDRGFSINDKGNGGSTALHLASSQGHKQLVELLIEHGDMNLCDADQNTALHLAYLNKHMDVFVYLLNHGSLVDAKGKDGSTILHLASGEGNQQVIQLLIEHGADVNLRDADQNTALHLAYLNKHMDVFVYLLNHGSLVDAKGKDGSTILHLASGEGNQQVIELLIKHGADVNLRDADQNTALHLAYLNEHMDVFVYLLNHGSLVDEKGKDGSTILHLASCEGNQQVIELLIKHGADVNLRDQDQNTAVFVAFTNGHREVAKCLLQFGVLVDGKSTYGQTMIHQAIISNNLALAQQLLQWEVEIDFADDLNQSALQLANQSKSSEIKAAFNQATSLQNKSLKSIPASALNQSTQFTLRLGNNKFGPDIWDTLASSLPCTQFLFGLFLQSNPSLGTIPDSVAKLGQLLCLSVADCSLSASSIRALALLLNLRSLDVSGNPLGDLPAEFSQLKELGILNVNKCNLSLVPAVIMQLSQLRDLDMSSNPLHGLPFDLGHLSLLTKLNLTDCPLTTIPREYRNFPTSELFQFLRDSQESSAVYRSKLLLVGYGEVGKTTLLAALLPLQLKHYDRFLAVSYQIHGQTLRVFNTNDFRDDWKLEKEIDLSGATVVMKQMGWTVQAADSTVVHEFSCKDTIGRDEWVRICQFLARNSRTDGISVIHRVIKSKELDFALQAVSPTTPNLALFEYGHQNKVPAYLKLSAWDFAGQYEYQDGHQLFLMSRAIYLVLWDVTPSKRKQELAKLRHWLITLQLHLGTTDNNMRSSVLVYIVGTHVDSIDAILLDASLDQVRKVVIECDFSLPHRIVDPIDARNQDYVNKLKNQLLADMAVQSHLGEFVPKGYLQIEQYLLEEQRKYRLNMLRGGNDVIVPIIQRKVLSERWHRDIPYVTRALELLNLWGSIVYFGRDSNKQRHILLDEFVVYAPQWLTIFVLGSIVQLMRQQRDKLKMILDENEYKPIVLHRDLIKLSSVWHNIPYTLHEHVMEMLYSLDLGFAVSPASDQWKPFAERSSFFPQLLPFLPPRLLTWQLITSTTTEAVYVIKFNGFAMGFHGVLFSRLQSLLKSVEYGSCWQCGFLFSDESQSTLVTIHDDTQQIRVCIRNSSNPAKSFNDIRVVIASLIDERYRGVRIIGEFIECACEKCKNVKWNWDNKIYDQAFNDSNIQSLCNDTTSRADLVIAIGRYNQPDGSPHLFNIEDITNTPSSQESLICKKSNNAALVSALKRLIEQPVSSIPVSATFPISATFPVRVALVVGNDEYIEKPLTHAVGDAVAVRNRLRELGFQTIQVFNGTKQQIDEAIAEFCLKIRLLSIHEPEPGVLLAIYFSGHAFQINGINLFQARTTHNPEDDQYIVLQDIIFQVEVVSQSFPLLSFPICIILDACRIGEDDSDFQKLNSSLDYLFVYACRSGQVASDGRLHEGYGPFATAVLRHLQRGRSLHDICGDIIIDTQGSGQQQPMFVNSCRKRTDADQLYFLQVCSHKEPNFMPVIIPIQVQVIDAKMPSSAGKIVLSITAGQLHRPSKKVWLRKEEKLKKEAMKHRINYRKLNRLTANRQMMFRNMVTQLIKFDRIQTTYPKAMELRRVAEKMVTLGKRGDNHARRQAAAVITEMPMVTKLFEETALRYLNRNGGYTRVLKAGNRFGDNAPVAIIEYVDSPKGNILSPRKEKLLRRMEPIEVLKPNFIANPNSQNKQQK